MKAEEITEGLVEVEDFLPCPFCDSPAEVHRISVSDLKMDWYYFIDCSNNKEICFDESPMVEKGWRVDERYIIERLRKRWNKRSGNNEG
jgi:hypothetical protein